MTNIVFEEKIAIGQPIYAMSIDPGGTNGLAFRLVDKTFFTAKTRYPETLYAIIEQYIPQHIIIETFQTSGRISSFGLATVEIVGGVKALCHSLKIPIAPHFPQKRKAYLSTAYSMLLAKGNKFVVHEQDALAHLLAWEYYHPL
jgi:hypothetical protein